jgi:16S rRNA (cytosine967-C5)-methyltransferase
MPAGVVGEIPGFQDGHLSVQDPAAQLAVDLLKLDAEHRVLDSCAAPGGKTCHILERFPSIEMTAIELSESRLGLIQENVDRLGFSGRDGLRLVAGDAAEPSDWWDGEPFDRILLDAPCTATGVIRRHPEIKWLRSTEQFEKVIQLQEKLLTRLWPLLKVDGILVYATCSVLVDENRSQISRFLADHNEAEAVFVEAAWGHDQNCGRQILPGEEEMDGFFYACMRKIA